MKQLISLIFLSLIFSSAKASTNQAIQAFLSKGQVLCQAVLVNQPVATADQPAFLQSLGLEVLSKPGKSLLVRAGSNGGGAVLSFDYSTEFTVLSGDVVQSEMYIDVGFIREDFNRLTPMPAQEAHLPLFTINKDTFAYDQQEDAFFAMKANRSCGFGSCGDYGFTLFRCE